MVPQKQFDIFVGRNYHATCSGKNKNEAIQKFIRHKTFFTDIQNMKAWIKEPITIKEVKTNKKKIPQKRFDIFVKNAILGTYSGRTPEEAIQNWLQETTKYNNISEMPGWWKKNITTKEIKQL